MGYRRFIPTIDHYEHVMIRTAQQFYWMKNPKIKKIFESIINFYSQIYYIEVVGYIFMDNHIHLILKIVYPEQDREDIRRRFELAQTRLVNPRKFRVEVEDHLYRRYTSLSEFMKEINQRMALTYNRIKGTSGHFWGARFKNIVVEDGLALLNTLTYVALNATRAGLIEDPLKYQFSSAGKMKRAMDRGEPVEAPNIRILRDIEEKLRATTFLDWIRYAALAIVDPEMENQPLPIHFTSRGLEINIKIVRKALVTRAPSNWCNRVYGSKEFRKSMYIQAGHPYTEPRARNGPIHT